MTKIVPMICPGCKSPMYGKDHDTVFLCSNCGTLHSRDGQIAVIEYEAAPFAKQSDGEKLYLPFWKAGVVFDIKSEHVDGALLGKLTGSAGKAGAGSIVMVLPAFNLEALRFKEIAKALTLNPPGYTPSALDPSVRREPCTVTPEMADAMADFLFVTIEAEKPGTLQQLVYDLNVTSKKLVYLPYYKKGNDLSPGY